MTSKIDNDKIKKNLEAVVDYLKTISDIEFSEVHYVFRMDLYQIWIRKSGWKAPLVFTEEELEEKSPEQIVEEVAFLTERFKADVRK